MAAQETEPTVGVVILNWNSFEAVSACVESVLELSYDATDIVVVDNGSTDGSGRRLQQAYPSVDVIRNEKNLGFAAGNNRGIQRVRERGADYVWLVNNDIKLPDSRTLGDLVEVMETNPDIGLLTPLIMEYPDTETIWFRRGRVNYRVGSYYHETNRRWYLHGLEAGQSTRTIEKPDGGRLIDTDYMPFACVLIRDSVFTDVGLLPERYFLYVEDVDYCTRTRAAGYRLATETDVCVHHESDADESLSPIRTYYGLRNRLLFARKHGSELNPVLFYSTYLLSVLLFLGQRMLARHQPSAVATLRGFVDGLRLKDGRGPYP